MIAFPVAGTHAILPHEVLGAFVGANYWAEGTPTGSIKHAQNDRRISRQEYYELRFNTVCLRYKEHRGVSGSR